MHRRRKLRTAIVAGLSGLVAASGTVVALNSAHADPIRYEAEDSTAVCDGTIESNHAGYSGTGFCDTPNTIGAAAQFTVTAATAGEATVQVRFANGSSGGARGADVVVNGATVTATSFEVTGAWSTWSTKTVTVPVNAGDNTIRLVATGSGGLPNIDYLDADVSGGIEQARHEAEDAPATCDGTIDSNHAGFSGSGFCNADNATGVAVQFTVDAAEAGTATLDIGYANGSSGRPADVVVNGSAVMSAAFAGTGAWATWSTETVIVQLDAGANTIRLEATGSAGLANIDYLDVSDGGTVDPPGGGDGQYEVEALTRGVTVVPSGSGRLVGWRLLGTDPQNVAFNVYRDGTKLNGSPITGATNYLDNGGSSSSQYTVRAVVNGTEGAAAGVEATFNSSGYLDVPIQRPAGGSNPSGSYSYEANDTSAADLDGDGTYELIVKWDPTNAHDNVHEGYTGNVYLDAYKLNGQRLWRIDLGRNIRAGAHYTQFQVYDYNSDGKAELAVKTADGTRDANGTVIGSSSADYRDSNGRILSGPEFLTIFNGTTGAAMDTVNYQPARGRVSDWGDNYGNRVDRFLAATAYLDGATPSMIFSRGYYTRTVIWAVDWNGTDLTTRWIFDSNQAGSQYEGQGNHQMAIADLNGDARQDIAFGAMAIGSNGQPLWNTRMGHGDALHVTDHIPSNPGQEVFMPGEWPSMPSTRLVDGDTGRIIMQTPVANDDNGRGVGANILASNPGSEYWSSLVSGLRNASGSNIGSKPSSTNFLSWWDGDGERELLNGTTIDNYSPAQRQLTGSGVSSNNGSKSTPALSADLFGDWREEVIWKTSNSSALRIYATPHQTNLRIPTLMHDPQYRVAVAWQNTGYNQPPHPSFYIGSDVTAYPWPDIHTP